MLRASSGKHARFVGVFAAGGDSVPADPGIRGIRGIRGFVFFGGFSSGRMRLNLPQDDLKSMVFFGD